MDKAFEQAVDAGAAVVRPLKDQFYGERSGTVRDPFGHEWLLGGHLETVTPQEMQRRYTEMTMARDAMLAIAWVTAPGPLRPILESFSALAVPIIATMASIVGFVGARRLARVVDVDVPIFDLPIALHGFTIVQVSDVQIGPTIKRPYVDAIVNAVNRLRPDLIAVTGDLVDGTVQELAADVAPLSRLLARNGSFFVTGNHEYYSDASAWTDELRRLGLRVLNNEHVTIHHHGAMLVLAGVPEFGAHQFNDLHRSDPHKAIAGAPSAAAVRILLAHQPRSAPEAARAGFDLQRSGHTHGGQFWPWNLFVRLQQPFTAGLHRLQQLWVYTSRGTGYWGPPTRFGVPSEITRLRLVPHTR